MPKGRRGSSGGPVPPAQTRLTVSVGEAQGGIDRQITRGTLLGQGLVRVSSREPFEEWRSEFRIWDDYNEALLRVIDSSGTLATEYSMIDVTFTVLGGQVSLEDDKTRAKDLLDRQLTRLRSIRGRLELFELASRMSLTPAVSAGVPPAQSQGRVVFVVHGHDDGRREAVARFLERLSLQAIILHENASRGRTLMGANCAVR